MKPFLLTRKCYVQKEICTAIKVCPVSAITFQADESEPLGGKILFDWETCTGCGLCARECCGEAVEMR